MLHQSLTEASNLDNKFMIESLSLMDQNLNPHAQVSTQESPFQVEMEPTAKKSQRGSNFTIEEDLLHRRRSSPYIGVAKC